MKCRVFDTKHQSAQAAAELGAQTIRAAISARGHSSIIVATGASQFEMLEFLVRQPDIDWYKVTAFHLDEYIGLTIDHPASFRKYMWERFVSQLPKPLKAFHYLDGDGDFRTTIAEKNAIIRKHQIDLAFVGIGENGHLAFNDPPADFQTEEPYLVVNLDHACRMQQVGEGWFKTLDDTPTQAISMSCRQIMKSSVIICTVPDERKAKAVQAAVEGPITPNLPSSIMQQHPHATLFLDQPAASLLKKA
ncbi:glucosamine-6-phosphate deaminase [soil metagenome]